MSIEPKTGGNWAKTSGKICQNKTIDISRTQSSSQDKRLKRGISAE
jgi:hypothetical protein